MGSHARFRISNPKGIVPSSGIPLGFLIRRIFATKTLRSGIVVCYGVAMQDSGTAAVLDGILDPVTGAFSREVAQALINVRANETAQARIGELAEKCNEGSITPDERVDYESYVRALDLISVLQAKARAWLARHDAA
jgi:hypothetical protein